MINSRRHQLGIALVLACICAAAFGQDANDAKTELKFEINAENAQRLYGKIKTTRTPIRPTHVAYVEIEWYHWQPTEPNISEILQTPIGQTVSQLQRDLPRTVPAIPLVVTKRLTSTYGFGSYPFGSNKYAVYAVSQEDAKKMAQALVEVLMKEADVALGPILKSYINKILSKKQELEKNVAQTKKTLLEKKAEWSSAEEKLQKKLKEGPHFMHELAHSSEAAKEAQATILEMNRILDSLNIEIAGIEAKLSAVREYRGPRSLRLRKEHVTSEGLAKLEQILIEQTVELAGASARKKAVLDIQTREREFLNLYKKWEAASYAIGKLKGNLSSYEQKLTEVADKLANPTPEMLPPTVFQNKVIIYPVRLD